MTVRWYSNVYECINLPMLSLKNCGLLNYQKLFVVFLINFFARIHSFLFGQVSFQFSV